MKKIVILFAALAPMLTWAQYDLLRPSTRTDVGLKGPVYQVMNTIHSVDDDSCWARSSSATYTFGGMMVTYSKIDLANVGDTVEHYYFAGNRLTSCEAMLPYAAENGAVAYRDLTYRLEYTEAGRLDRMITFFPAEDNYIDSIVANVQCNVKGYPARLTSATDTFVYEYNRAGKLDMQYHYAKDMSMRSKSFGYDNDGRLLRVQENSVNGPVSATIYTYDDKGNMTYKAITTWDPATKVTYNYTYTGNVDKYGNWLSRHVTITTNGKVVHCYETRSIVYYK
ncbi:MAG: hypothetical protein K5650_02175 [Bacteroidales bacterium]|nr:hypothetical protein [Bacteroidales bacterium]